MTTSWDTRHGPLERVYKAMFANARVRIGGWDSGIWVGDMQPYATTTVWMDW